MKSFLPLLAAMTGLVVATAGLPCSVYAGEVTVVTTHIDGCGYARGVFGPYAYSVAWSASGYPACMGPAAAYYSYRYEWGHPWIYPYPYAAHAPYAPYGIAYGSAGVAAWGPFGGVAATTGTATYQYANGWSAYRAGGAYNPWTGNGAVQRSKAVYDANTGTYAAGRRGAAYNERTGAGAAGRHVTVGNAATGNEVQAARGVAYDPVSGQAVRAGGVRGENGGVARVNDRVFVGRNGNVQQVTTRGPAGQRRPAPKR